MRAFSQAQVLIAESVLLDSRLALFHEQEKWLAIADLHFGYELSQRVAGRLVPFWGMESIETRLRQLLHDYHPATLILLGDLVHDQTAASEFFSLVRRLREQCDVVLLAGRIKVRDPRVAMIFSCSPARSTSGVGWCASPAVSTL